MVILFFGQPASGKTTLADAFVETASIIYNDHKFIRLDGDEWRNITDNKNYTKEGRMVNLKSAFASAIFLDNQGFTPVLSFVAPYKEARQWLYSKTVALPIYLHSDTDRGRSNYRAKDFEMPFGQELILQTDRLSIKACVSWVLETFQANLK